MAAYLVSYSTKGFYKRHQELIASSQRFGLSNIISYYDTDLAKSAFFEENKMILQNPKGAGFWLWKPYYIHEALKQIKENDLLFYVDAASIFVNSPDPLFELATHNKAGVIAFDSRPLTNRQFCRRDAFINLHCDESKYWDAPHCIATMMLFRKCESSVSFVEEWLKECQNPFNIVNNNNSDEYLTNNKELEGFIDHRSDQSIFSILVAKKGLETFRNPTIWGNYLKLPNFRKQGEHVSYPYHVENSITDYSKYPMENSPYGTIFEINRGRDPEKANLFQKIKNNILKGSKA